MVSNLDLLKECSLFANIDENDLQIILEFSEERHYAANEYIIHEGAPDYQEFYIIKSGRVEILKQSSNVDDAQQYVISHLSAGETFGEIALLEDVARTASIRASQDTEVIVISIKKIKNFNYKNKELTEAILIMEKLKSNLAKPSVLDRLSLNISKQLGMRLSNTNSITAEAFRLEIESQRVRIDSVRFFLTMLFILALYSYFSAYLHSIVNSTYTQISPSLKSSIVSVIMMIVFFGGTVFVLSKNSFPLSFYGITTKNWKKSAFEGFLSTIPLILLLLIIKFIALQIYGYDNPVLEYNPQGLSIAGFILIGILYFIMATMQEIVARGAMQGSLEHFLDGPYTNLMAILLSNLLFGMIHLHISMTLAFGVLIFGMFWGWLYWRHKNIIGVSISHAITGFIGFQVIGFIEFVSI